MYYYDLKMYTFIMFISNLNLQYNNFTYLIYSQLGGQQQNIEGTGNRRRRNSIA